jgi:RNA-directed DNA polymerase
MAISPPLPKDLAAFKSLMTVSQVATFFNTSQKRLLYLLYDPRGPQYHTFLIRKASGGQRLIAAPSPVIAVFQRKLLACMTEFVTPLDSAHAFTLRRSVVTNARVHLDANLILNIDLLDFFPTFHFDRVKGMYRSRPFYFPDAVATVLAHICCFNGRLPQGAPTSPMIANIICRGLDRDLWRLARNHGCRYTRYADDITFSTNKDNLPISLLASLPRLQTPAPTLGPSLLAILAKHSLTINSKKTRIRRKSERQEVTGIVINEKINVPRDFVRNVRSILHDCEANGVQQATLRFLLKDKKKTRLRTAPPILKHLRGKLDYLKMVRGGDDPIYVRLAIRAEKILPTKKYGISIFGRSAEVDRLLANTVWVVLGLDHQGNEVEQGTAFTLEGAGIVSARHLFENGKKNGARRWVLRNAAAPAKQHSLTGYRADPTTDLAVLETPAPTVAALLRDTRDLQVRDKLWIVGFPNWFSVNDQLLIERTDVVQTKHLAGLLHILTKGNVRSGNSGGPFLSKEGYVSGVVLFDNEYSAAPHGGLAIDHINLAAASSATISLVDAAPETTTPAPAQQAQSLGYKERRVLKRLGARLRSVAKRLFDAFRA